MKLVKYSKDKIINIKNLVECNLCNVTKIKYVKKQIEGFSLSLDSLFVHLISEIKPTNNLKKKYFKDFFPSLVCTGFFLLNLFDCDFSLRRILTVFGLMINKTL